MVESKMGRWGIFSCRTRIPIFKLLVMIILLYFAGLSFLFSFPTLKKGSYYLNNVTRPDGISIDDVIKGKWKRGPGHAQYLPKSCRPQNNLVFIKCMKCATETLGTVFRRYGYQNNLSVVLPVEKRLYLGWPFPITDIDYRPSSRGYNLLMEHAIYNGTFMRRLMNPGSVFITMIREPLDMFFSVLHYFNVFELANVTVKHGLEAVQTYLRHIHKYETVYKSPAAAPKRYCIPDGFSITKNLLSHCLGMPLGFPPGSQSIEDDMNAVVQYIKNLDSEFLLVMIMEYFDESLVLLKRLMCWDTKDILYYSNNFGAYQRNASSYELKQHDRDLHRQWSRVDYLLYDHFNRTFWRKVHQQGHDFQQEVFYFRHVQHQVSRFCLNLKPYNESYIQFPESVWSPAFIFSSEECQLMVSPLLEMLKKRYEKQEPKYASSSNANIQRKFVPLC